MSIQELEAALKATRQKIARQESMLGRSIQSIDPTLYEKEQELEEIHCLICEGTFPENVMLPIVKACPHCGNIDKEQTVYLSKEQDNA